MRTEIEHLDVDRVLAVLRPGWWVIALLTALLKAHIGYGYVLHQTDPPTREPQREASAEHS